jgi:hypothetical protein
MVEGARGSCDGAYDGDMCDIVESIMWRGLGEGPATKGVQDAAREGWRD